MACITLLVSMSAQKRKAREAMIEEDLVGPRVFVMAVEAVRPLGALVRVVLLVAGQAAGLRLDLEDRLDMTGFALHQFVRAVQRMIGVGIVVEVNCRPCVGGVAGLAGCSEVSVVIVVFEVAGDAGDVHLVVERVLAVAVAAGQLRVPPIQCKTGVASVIERRIFPAGR